MFKKIKVILAIFIILVCFTSVTCAANVDDLGNNTEALLICKTVLTKLIMAE